MAITVNALPIHAHSIAIPDSEMRIDGNKARRPGAQVAIERRVSAQVRHRGSAYA
jgi:hypothetical protein